MVWADAIRQWSDWLTIADHSGDSIELRQYQLIRLASYYPNRSPWDLSTTDLASWLATHTWGRETRRSYRSAVRSFYTWARTVGHLDESPADTLPTIKRKRHLPRPTPDDIYMSALDGATDQLRLVLLLLGYEGLRCAEAARLHRNDATDTSLRIRGKGDKERILPLHRLVAAELADELARRDTGGCGTGYRYTAGLAAGWIFPGRYGGHIQPGSIGQMVKRAVGPNWTAHTIRHRFACRTYELTHDLAVVQELMGHASPETTRIYTKVPTAFLTAAVDAL